MSKDQLIQALVTFGFSYEAIRELSTERLTLIAEAHCVIPSTRDIVRSM